MLQISKPQNPMSDSELREYVVIHISENTARWPCVMGNFEVIFKRSICL